MAHTNKVNHARIMSIIAVFLLTIGLNEAKEKHSSQWYNNLNELYKRFSDYKIQQDRSRYNVSDLKDWGELERPQGININSNNIQMFLKNIAKDEKIKYYRIDKNMNITETHLHQLNYILNLTLKSRLKFDCPGPGILTIEGDFVKFSDFVGINGIEIQKFCVNKTEIKSVQIFSSNTVFIDRDLETQGNEFQVIIMAPKWKIIGTRKIRVTLGSKSETRSEVRYQYDESYFGYNFFLIHNSPERVGGPGGTFLGAGVDLQMKKGDSLKIDTSGGTEGKGDIEKPVEIIGKYKRYIRQNLKDPFKKSSLIQFLKSLNINNEINGLYDTSALINELKDLEKEFYDCKSDCKIEDFLPSYETLLNKIIQSAQSPKITENSDHFNDTISLLYVATRGRVYNLKRRADNLLIVNVTAHLDLVKHDVNNFKDLKIKETERLSQYGNEINEALSNIANLLENQVIPAVKAGETKMNNEIDLLVHEIKTLHASDKTRLKIGEWYEKTQNLEDTLAIKVVLDILNFESYMVSSIIRKMRLINKSINTKTVEEKPEGSIEAIADTGIEHFKKFLEEIFTKMNKYPEKLKDILDIIADAQKRVEKTKTIDDLKILRLLLRQQLVTKLKELENRNNAQILEANTTKISSVKKFINYIKLESLLPSTYDKYRNQKENRNIILDATEELGELALSIADNKADIHNNLIQIAKNIDENLAIIAEKKYDKTEILFPGWQVQYSFRYVNHKIQHFSELYDLPDNILDIIQKLEDATAVIIDQHIKMESYQEHINLVDHFSSINFTTPANDSSPTDPRFTAMQYLKTMISSNVLLEKYDPFVDAVKQFLFPFGQLGPKALSPPLKLGLIGLTHNASGKRLEIEDLVSAINVQLDDIQRKLDNRSLISKYEMRRVFNGDSTKSFFVWKNEQYKNTISRLLSGQEVMVQPDIRYSLPNKDAIKFNIIDFFFIVKNRTLQLELNKLLHTFQMSSTHMGNSHYWYNDKIFNIYSNPIQFLFSLEKTNKGEPVMNNMVCEKIKNGDFMLSPYATWKIELIPSAKHHERDAFRNLEKFKDKVDLELAGFGHYINMRGEGYPNISVENDYSAIDVNDYIFSVEIDKY